MPSAHFAGIERISPSFTKVFVGNGCFWFSYTTLVAFNHLNTGLVVHENIWSHTTGKHLNMIDSDRDNTRVNASEFNRLYNLIFSNESTDS
jgi:hypothetical protein